jgi:hypothetical protein
MSIPPQTYRMSIIDLVFARSYGMRFQEYGFGELGKKLLVDFLILDHFHRLLAGRDVLAISRLSIRRDKTRYGPPAWWRLG